MGINEAVTSIEAFLRTYEGGGATAQAYAQRPESSGTVLAVSHLFTPLGLAMPFALGAIADDAGTHVALAALLVQPLGLLALAMLSNTPGSRRGS